MAFDMSLVGHGSILRSNMASPNMNGIIERNLGLLHPLLGPPESVEFSNLKIDPERFQVRNPAACSFVTGTIKKQESVQLSADLRKLAADGVTLDPIVVWEDAEGQLWVIDGHHRMEAMAEADFAPTQSVLVQRYSCTAEADARQFALDINRRLHLNMHPDETLEAYWRMLLCGEVVGSVRERVRRYLVSKSTVQRMDKEKPAVLEQLEQQASTAGALFDVAYIRSNAPTWKTLATWRESEDQPDDTDLDRKAVENVIRILAVRLEREVRARPEVVLQAFVEFYEGATGRRLTATSGASDHNDEDEF